MPLTPNLSPSIRQQEPAGLGEAEDLVVEILEDGEDKNEYDDKGNILRMVNDDGSVVVSLNGEPVERVSDAEKAADWFRNLVDEIDTAV